MGKTTFQLDGWEKYDGTIWRPFYRMTFKDNGKLKGEFRYQGEDTIYEIDGEWAFMEDVEGNYIEISWCHGWNGQRWDYAGYIDDDGSGIIYEGAMATGCINGEEEDTFEYYFN
jgi:hypothetical protein